MTIHLFDAGGVPHDRPLLTWKELVPKPISKLVDDAFTQALEHEEAAHLTKVGGWLRSPMLEEAT